MSIDVHGGPDPSSQPDRTARFGPNLIKVLPVCDRPEMFAQAPEVCANCGNLIDAHRLSAVPNATLQAMWKIMIRHGGTYSQYGGGMDRYGGDLVREHMASCAIDFTRTEQPKMDGLSAFVDSFSENEPVTILHGDLYCACGKYVWQHICIDDMTLGELIWQVVHLDDDVRDGATYDAKGAMS